MNAYTSMYCVHVKVLFQSSRTASAGYEYEYWALGVLHSMCNIQSDLNSNTLFNHIWTKNINLNIIKIKRL